VLPPITAGRFEPLDRLRARRSSRMPALDSSSSHTSLVLFVSVKALQAESILPTAYRDRWSVPSVGWLGRAGCSRARLTHAVRYVGADLLPAETPVGEPAFIAFRGRHAQLKGIRARNRAYARARRAGSSSHAAPALADRSPAARDRGGCRCQRWAAARVKTARCSRLSLISSPLPAC